MTTDRIAELHRKFESIGLPSDEIAELFTIIEKLKSDLADCMFDDHADKDIDKAQRRVIKDYEIVVTDLKQQITDLQAIIEKHNLCHDLHGKVGQAEFEEGCRRETVKEFGSCSWSERISAEQKRLEAAKEYVAFLEKYLGIPARLGMNRRTEDARDKYLKAQTEQTTIPTEAGSNEIRNSGT